MSNRRFFAASAGSVVVRPVTQANQWSLSGIGGLVMLAGLAWSGGVQAQTRPDSFADLTEMLKPAVVTVTTGQSAAATTAQGPAQGQQGQSAPQGQQRRSERPQAAPGSPFEEFFRDFFDRQQREGGGQPAPRGRRPQSLGSGFIIDPRGYVVTNNHVVAEGDQYTVTLDDNRTLEAKLIGKDQKTDLAVLKIESPKPLPAVKWADSDTARVGDWVLAIGNPFGLGGSVSAGIISARGRNINAGPYDDFLQTDATINKGNSGGPLFNLKGEVVGINTAIFSPNGMSAGIGFAIPANLAKTTVNQLIDFGRTRRGWLGVQIQSVTEDMVENLKLDSPKGALVAKVNKDGPADKAGIEQGDVIIRFDNKPVPEMRDLPRIVAETAVDREVEVVLMRKGKERKVKTKVGELVETETASLGTEESPSPGRPSTNEVLGMALSTVTPDLRRQFEIKGDTQGVVITGVSDGSPASERGIRPGDVIVEVNQESVKSPAEVDAKIKAVQKANRKSVLFLVERGGDLRFVAIRLGDG
ncbi:MAG: DegQ family serine endoprotease [Alphaproteobacteria bacterium]|nr:DegQ family serine endoprotease [Alphaproteobacteria bacterium]